jgi:hypothetical protein
MGPKVSVSVRAGIFAIGGFPVDQTVHGLIISTPAVLKVADVSAGYSSAV